MRAIKLGFALALGLTASMPSSMRSWESAALAAPAKSPPKAPASKQVTLSGTLGCGKCSFHEAKACENVLKVKDGDKEVSYVLADNAVSQANHEKVCGPTSPATVTGKVSSKAGKKVLTASAITFN